MVNALGLCFVPVARRDGREGFSSVVARIYERVSCSLRRSPNRSIANGNSLRNPGSDPLCPTDGSRALRRRSVSIRCVAMDTGTAVRERSLGSA